MPPPQQEIDQSTRISSARLKERIGVSAILDHIFDYLNQLRPSPTIATVLEPKKLATFPELLSEILAEQSKQMKLFSDLPPPPKPTGMPQWQKAGIGARCIILDRKKARIKAFSKCMGLLPDGAFKRFLAENQVQLIPALTRMDTEQHIPGVIAKPNFHALEGIATKYYEKYQVLIRIASSDPYTQTPSMRQVVNELEEGIEGPQFAAIVFELQDYEHALPVICFFGKKNKKAERVRQFLIADVLGDDGFLFTITNAFFEALKGSEVFYCADKVKRQADAASCRIGAIQLAKHALLTLRDAHCTHGLKEFLLEHAKCNPKDVHQILSLPGQFNYSEQPTNRLANLDLTIARDRYSKQARKRSAPRTIKQHRVDYAQKIEAIFTFVFATSLSLTLPKDLEIESSNFNCVLYGDNRIGEIRILSEMVINSYLQKKAEKLARAI